MPAITATTSLVVHVVQWSDGICSNECASIWATSELAEQECNRARREPNQETVEWWHKPVCVFMAPRPSETMFGVDRTSQPSDRRITGHHCGCPSLGIQGSDCTCPPE